MGLADPQMEAIDLVDVHLLEPIPQEAGESVSVQGRLRKHANFWMNEFDASSLIMDIVVHGYQFALACL